MGDETALLENGEIVLPYRRNGKVEYGNDNTMYQGKAKSSPRYDL